MEPSHPESEVLLFEKSPYGNLDAIVERDQRTVYFYLNGDEAFGMRACWVRNLVTGPLAFNQEDLRGGAPPVLPRIHTLHPHPGEVPDPEQLEIVWFAEGNAAALCERRHPLAVIPPWSGLDGFHGYAAECAAENEVCWPMPQQSALLERIESSRRFWEAWRTAPPFPELQQKQLEIFAERFGRESHYFAIDGGNFPPRGLAQFDSEEGPVLTTIGMSLCPMPMVEMQSEHPKNERRIELALRLPPSMSPEQVQQAAGRLSGLASFPWRKWTWLGHGHTCDWLPGDYPAAGLWRDEIQSSAFLPETFGDPVHLLWVVPLTRSQWNAVQNQQRRIADFL